LWPSAQAIQLLPTPVGPVIKSPSARSIQSPATNNAAAFIGAGLSKAAGYVDWPGLLSDVAKGLGLDTAKETDLIALAQYHLNSNATNRHQLSRLLIDEFSDLKEPTENHAILARLPIRIYWTTNYDRLIEKALEAGGKRVDSKYTKEHLAMTKRGRDALAGRCAEIGDCALIDAMGVDHDRSMGWCPYDPPWTTASTSIRNSSFTRRSMISRVFGG
jgi:hypothetical protein